ncbi:hypothetical protein [Teredinibacter sp. KSP-S5-2]|uniref:hypothetical protein n=1 Tax=Teredinibacter sp. KSP-S5-2 TaxID=3034506 RepID=UPI002934D96A|nr:hypothetical protein [Teredinibacter sp. KSP-S5-2]WNO09193.1 hypothetical protein P5V12_19820 [Teredinibacter sp. KSP-S5-2]
MSSDQVKNKKAKLTLVAIIVVSVLPIAAAYFMFFTGIGVPDHTVNKGLLLPKAIPLEEIVDTEFSNELNQNKKWRLLLPVPAQCTEQCQKNLYTTRQVHIRLGEKGLRLERIAANLNGIEGEAYLASIQSEHPKLKTFTVDKQIWNDWVKQSGLALDMQQEHYYFLVDQQSFAMMAYTNKQHGNDLLKDIKRALKHSIDYQ